jgi:tRNA (guanine-N7-)-methyltransferase
LVIEANQERERLGLSNLAFVFGNMNVAPEILLQSLPADKLFWVSIQFPDPWFKQRHSKRRVVQPELVIALAKYMVAGGWVFLQSDVESIALEMTERFQAHPHFVRQHQTPWLAENIFPVPTEREKSTYNKSQPVYRSLFRVR